MLVALLVSRLVLAAVFLVAAAGKSADLLGSRQALEGFGLGARVAAPLGLLLPLVELTLAVSLLPASSAWWGAMGMAALLTLFLAAIAAALVRGEAPDCHCFGRLHSGPVGRSTLIRNTVLAGLAAFVVAAGANGAGPSAVGWLGRLSEAGAVAVGCGAAFALVIPLVARMLVGLLRQNGRLLLRLEALEAKLDPRGATLDEVPEGLPVGSPAVPFTLPGLYGESVTLDSLMAGDRPVLLLFVDLECGPCNAMLPRIAAWQRAYAIALMIAVITRGSADDNRARMREHGVSDVWLDDGAVYEAYGVNGTPSGVLVDLDGRILSQPAAGAEAIAELLDQVLAQAATH